MSCSTAEEKRIYAIAADRDYWREKCLEYERATSGYDPEIGFVLDFANAGELAAYDQASKECLAAVTDILDGKHRPGGVANEPWETVRRRLLNLVAENQHARKR